MGNGEGPIYDGGTVTFGEAHSTGTVSVLIERNTSINQNVNYRPYDPFPAETHEFALDKLTMIAQEQDRNVSAGGSVGDYIPLVGTVGGKPVTGPITFDAAGTGGWKLSEGPLFGVNSVMFQAQVTSAGFYIKTKDSTGDPKLFSFTPDGEFFLPTGQSGSDNVWAFKAAPFGFFGDNTLALYPWNTGTKTISPETLIVFTDEDKGILFNVDGTAQVVGGVVNAGSNGDVLTTKTYVDGAIAGAGGLPPSSGREILMGDNAGAWKLSQYYSYNEDITDHGSINYTGTMTFQNVDVGGGLSLLGNYDGLGGHYFAIVGDGPTHGTVIANEGYGGENQFTFAAGELTLPKDPTSDMAAATKQYVDANSGGGGTLPTGADTQMMRHNGTDWEATSALTINSGLEVVAANPMTAENNLTAKSNLTIANKTVDARGWTFSVDDFLTSNTLAIAGSHTINSVVFDVGSGNDVVIQTDGRLSVAADPTDDGDVGNRAFNDSRYAPNGAGQGIIIDDDIAVDPFAVVLTTGNQSVGGTKTFTASPIVPDATANTHALNLQFADGRYINDFSVQTVGGVKTFTSQVRANGGVLVDSNSYLAWEGNKGNGDAVWFGDNLIGGSSSDRRLKENIQPYSYGLEFVNGLEVVEFDWKEDAPVDGHQVGLIAQDVPEEVAGYDTGLDLHTVHYNKLVPYLIQAVQDLTARVRELEER